MPHKTPPQSSSLSSSSYCRLVMSRPLVAIIAGSILVILLMCATPTDFGRVSPVTGLLKGALLAGGTQHSSANHQRGKNTNTNNNKCLVIVSLHNCNKTSPTDAAEWVNLEHFLLHGYVSPNTPTKMFSSVEYLFVTHGKATFNHESYSFEAAQRQEQQQLLEKKERSNGETNRSARSAASDLQPAGHGKHFSSKHHRRHRQHPSHSHLTSPAIFHPIDGVPNARIVITPPLASDIHMLANIYDRIIADYPGVTRYISINTGCRGPLMPSAADAKSWFSGGRLGGGVLRKGQDDDAIPYSWLDVVGGERLPEHMQRLGQSPTAIADALDAITDGRWSSSVNTTVIDSLGPSSPSSSGSSLSPIPSPNPITTTTHRHQIVPVSNIVAQLTVAQPGRRHPQHLSTHTHRRPEGTTTADPSSSTSSSSPSSSVHLSYDKLVVGPSYCTIIRPHFQSFLVSLAPDSFRQYYGKMIYPDTILAAIGQREVAMADVLIESGHHIYVTGERMLFQRANRTFRSYTDYPLVRGTCPLCNMFPKYGGWVFRKRIIPRNDFIPETENITTTMKEELFKAYDEAQHHHKHSAGPEIHRSGHINSNNKHYRILQSEETPQHTQIASGEGSTTSQRQDSPHYDPTKYPYITARYGPQASAANAAASLLKHMQSIELITKALAQHWCPEWAANAGRSRGCSLKLLKKRRLR